MIYCLTLEYSFTRLAWLCTIGHVAKADMWHNMQTERKRKEFSKHEGYKGKYWTHKIKAMMS